MKARASGSAEKWTDRRRGHDRQADEDKRGQSEREGRYERERAAYRRGEHARSTNIGGRDRRTGWAKGTGEMEGEMSR